MKSTFGGLNTLVRGIYANQVSLDTVGHNITNSLKEGYSRQRVNLTTTRPETIFTSTGRVQTGTGVDIQSITRTRNAFFDQQMWKEGSSLGYGQTTIDTLGRIEGVFREPSSTGLQTVFNKFWESWQTLAKNASDDGCRTTVRQRGVELVDTIQHAAQQLCDINNDMNSVIDIKVNKINQTTSEIASLNKQIVNIEVSGDHANDLRDRRDLLVDQLSQMIDVRCREDKYGNYILQTSGQVLVDGDKNTKLTTAKTVDPNVSVNNFGLEKNYVYVEGSSQRLEFTNGEVKGLIDARDDSVFGIDAYLGKLNEISKFFLKDFNDLHNTGYDLNNNQGQNFFGDASIDYKKAWPPANAAPGTGTWLSQLKVNDNLFAAKGTDLIAAKTLAKIDQSNTNSGRAILTGNYTGTANTQKYVVTVDGVDATGKVTGIKYDIYDPPTSTTPTSSGTINTLQADGSFSLPNGISMKINKDQLTKTGDTYTFMPIQANAAGDNAVKFGEALKSGIRSKEVFGKDYDSTLEDLSLDTYYGSMTGALGVQSQNAKRLTDNQQTLVDQINNWREAESGVNMDEEMSNMIKFQKGYNACARVITTIDEMLDKIINGMGTVGR